MQAHRVVRQVEQNELSEFETFPVIQALAALDLSTAHIDTGRIAVQYEEQGRPRAVAVEGFVRGQVAGLLGGDPTRRGRPVDVELYGFGRNCRLMARLLIEEYIGSAAGS